MGPTTESTTPPERPAPEEPGSPLWVLARLAEAQPRLRPFAKTDYYGWAGVSQTGPHYIADLDDGVTVVVDGSHIEVSWDSEHSVLIMMDLHQ